MNTLKEGDSDVPIHDFFKKSVIEKVHWKYCKLLMKTSTPDFMVNGEDIHLIYV